MVTFWKNFHLCLSSSTLLKPSTPPKQDQDHDHDHDHHSSATASILLNDINHLIHPHHRLISSSNDSNRLTTATHFTDTSDFFSSSTASSSDSSWSLHSPPDFAAVLSSNRFFFSSPGRSNSIVESPDRYQRPPSVGRRRSIIDGGSVAVKKYSPDPYSDFRWSMEEMIEAREVRDVKGEWEFLDELLFSYLNLNPKNTHKFIITAFADIIVSIMSTSTSTSTSSLPFPLPLPSSENERLYRRRNGLLT